jgi:hypothetical protein
LRWCVTLPAVTRQVSASQKLKQDVAEERDVTVVRHTSLDRISQ